MMFEKKPKAMLFKGGRNFSFCLMLGFFMAVLYLLAFQGDFLKENLLLFGEAILGMMLINVVFPRALELAQRNELSNGMKEGSKLFAEKFSHFITIIALSITYVIGAGFVFIVSRIFRKKFMDAFPGKKQSYWIEKKEMGKSDEMF